MARGGRGGGNKRKGTDGPKRLTKKQKKDLEEYGELHPADQKATGREKYKTVKDEEASYSRRSQGTYGCVRSTHEDENASAYQQLLASIVNDALDSGGSDDEAAEVENEEPEDTSPVPPGENQGGVAGGDRADYEDPALLEGESDNEEATEPGLPSGALDEQLEIDREDYRALGLQDEEDEEINMQTDPFSIHFERDLPEELANRMSSQQEWCRAEVTLPQLGNCQMSWPQVLQQPASPACPRHYTLQHMHVKRRLASYVPATSAPLSQGHHVDTDGLSNLQHSVFTVLNNYQDLLFCDRDHKNGEQLRLTYCMHALNHVLKTKSRVLAHNSKIRSRQDQHVDYRDQGLTRPKVLIVVPFRNAALRIVRLLASLLVPDNQKFVSSKKRFEQEFDELEPTVSQGKKPEDFEAIFSGNVDDHFRIGIGIAKKTIKLYSEFYSSDIIIASPLGLRTIIGAEGEAKRDFDFLSSIEMLIFDQADVFLMQNWEHVLHLMNHLNLQPKEPHDVDFSRVRMWALNGWSRIYRQTVILSSISFPELYSLFNVHGHNFSGKLLVPKATSDGSICQIVAQLPQVFQQIQTPSMEQLADARFNYFIEKVLPEHKDPVMARTLIFIPSYFDYVRLRNYFKKEKLDFVHLCEYSSPKAVSRARAKFFHGKAHFFLFTERLHFFKRYQMRGICHLIFYELPHYSNYYSEMCNMLLHSRRPGRSSLVAAAENLTCTVIYSRYEAHQLADVVGRQRASLMLQSQKSTHMFVTGDNMQ